jgi:hypothetical protein
MVGRQSVADHQVQSEGETARLFACRRLHPAVAAGRTLLAIARTAQEAVAALLATVDSAAVAASVATAKIRNNIFMVLAVLKIKPYCIRSQYKRAVLLPKINTPKEFSLWGQTCYKLSI